MKLVFEGSERLGNDVLLIRVRLFSSLIPHPSSFKTSLIPHLSSFKRPTIAAAEYSATTGCFDGHRYRCKRCRKLALHYSTHDESQATQ